MNSLLLKLTLATGVLCFATIVGRPSNEKAAAAPASYARLLPLDGNPLPLCPPVCAPKPGPKKPATHDIAE